MKREFLEKLELEKEVIDEIMAEHGRGVQDLKAKAEELENKEKEVKLLENQLKEAEKTIKGYKDMDIEQIKKSALEFEEKLKEKQEEIKGLKENQALEKAVLMTNTLDSDVLISLIDKSILKFEDGKITGLQEQIKALQESKPYLFKGEDKKPEDDRFFEVHKVTQSDDGEIDIIKTQMNDIAKGFYEVQGLTEVKGE